MLLKTAFKVIGGLRYPPANYDWDLTKKIKPTPIKHQKWTILKCLFFEIEKTIS